MPGSGTRSVARKDSEMRNLNRRPELPANLAAAAGLGLTLLW
jgi:hypothetical protein